RPRLYFDPKGTYPVATATQNHFHFVRFTASLVMSLALILALSIACLSQQRAARTIDEIKTAAVHRPEVGQYPLIGLDAGDASEALKSVHTKDKDEWAAAFMGVADR